MDLVFSGHCMAINMISNFTGTGKSSIMSFKQRLLQHSALGSSEPRDIWLTELILCILAVTLHKTVVFHWIEKMTVATLSRTLVALDWITGQDYVGRFYAKRSWPSYCHCMGIDWLEIWFWGEEPSFKTKINILCKIQCFKPMFFGRFFLGETRWHPPSPYPMRGTKIKTLTSLSSYCLAFSLSTTTTSYCTYNLARTEMYMFLINNLFLIPGPDFYDIPIPGKIRNSPCHARWCHTTAWHSSCSPPPAATWRGRKCPCSSSTHGDVMVITEWRIVKLPRLRVSITPGVAVWTHSGFAVCTVHIYCTVHWLWVYSRLVISPDHYRRCSSNQGKIWDRLTNVHSDS